MTDDEAQRDANRRSGLQDSDTSGTTSQDNTSAVSTFGATGTTPPSGDITGLGATNNAVSGIDTDVAPVTDTNTATLVVDLPQDLDQQESDDPVAVLTAIELDSELLAGGGLSTDGPVAPPLPGVILAGLDQARRDLEQMSAPLNDDTTPGTTDPLIVDPTNNDSGPVLLAAEDEEEEDPPQPPSSKVSNPLTIDPTLEERNAAFQKNQAKRIEAFTEAQAERTKAFNEQQAAMSANPLGAVVNSVGFVVSELANTAAFVVTEFVNYISAAVTNIIQGISDWFTAPAVFTGMYGDPAASAQYWRGQSYNNCVVMSMAMVVGELTGTSPTEAEILQLASTTPSVVRAGQVIWPSNQQPGIDIKDGVELLRKYNIEATVTEYAKTEGNLALRAVAFALQDKKAVSVGVDADVIWKEVDGEDPPLTIPRPNHQVVVTGIDFDARVVHLNDSGPKEDEQGRNMKVSLDTFMRAWQSDDYETVIATLKVPTTSTSGVTSTNFSGSTVLVNVG